MTAAKAEATWAVRAEAAKARAQAAESKLWSWCPVCQHDKRLDRPVDEPGALYLEHAIFVPVPHAQGELPLRRETCGGSLMPVSPSLAPDFSSADIGDGGG